MSWVCHGYVMLYGTGIASESIIIYDDLLLVPAMHRWFAQIVSAMHRWFAQIALSASGQSSKDASAVERAVPAASCTYPSYPSFDTEGLG